MTLNFSGSYWCVSMARKVKATRTERREAWRAYKEKLEAAGYETEYRYPMHAKTVAESKAAEMQAVLGDTATVEVCRTLGASF